MKICPYCNSQLEDNVTVCPTCGNPQPAQQPYQQPPVGYAPPVVDPTDHTAEFSPEDIAENKLYAIAVYFLGAIGIIIALLANKESAFLKYHIKQCLRLTIAITIVSLATFILSFTIIGGIAGCIFLMILAIVYIIAIVNVCKGRAKDAPIISSWEFLK